ncbi:GrpB family protein [Bacillus cereus group sp. MG9]|uniref:GrpB family protein n=1 Tax=Bacillus cereus group sp. MG9 TaxID=3040247 RepID=UPI00339319C6
MSDKIIVVPYKSEWSKEFQNLGDSLRSVLGDVAIRIDHIGSTSIPGLAAKPIIDIQISVNSLELLDSFKKPLKSLGFIYRADNSDRSKSYFREIPDSKRTHIHVRREGSWPEQLALLFRDYMRTHPEDCKQYGELKYRLAEKYTNNRHMYTESKDPLIWEILRKADKWSQNIGWIPQRTDA